MTTEQQRNYTAGQPMGDDFDQQMIRRAIALAMQGRGSVEPNPMVGCVMVHAGRVIGEGYHQHYGRAHAEPTALTNCTESPAGGTAYVTLEPCCHTNKQTPPCAPQLIRAGIARVVVGCLDPNPDVNGNGVRMLREAGIRVDYSELEPECRQLIAPFVAVTRLQRPYITLKWAQTSDGKIAGPGGAPLRITGELATRAVHQLRSRCEAIAIGINTAINDDPLLTVRGVDRPQRLPMRVIFDTQLRTPLGGRLAKTASQTDTLVVYGKTNQPDLLARRNHLQAMGLRILAVNTLPDGRIDLTSAIAAMRLPNGRSPTHFLIEPGASLAKTLLSENEVDRLWVFTSEKPAADSDSFSAPVIPPGYAATATVPLGPDQLIEYLNCKSDTFSTASASADIVLMAK